MKDNVNHCSCAPDFDIGYTCETHDYYYDIGGNKADRLDADRYFRGLIIEHGVNKKQPIRYAILAQVYYLGVRIFGWRTFNYHYSDL